MMIRSRQAGLSLIEVMIGMILGLIVVSGAVAVYLASSRSYSQAEQVGQLNETTRFVEQVLTDGLRHVGFMGEASSDKIEVDITALGAIANNCNGDVRSDAYNIAVPIFAAKATANAAVPDIGCIANGALNDAVLDSEILIIKSARPFPISDVARDDSGLGTANDTLDHPDDPQAGKLYLLTNNAIGRMFDSDVMPYPTISIGGDIPGGTAWEYRYEAYFIREETAPDGKLLPRLSRFVLAEQSSAGPMELQLEDLVPDVEDMRLRLGLDTDGDGEVDIYRSVDDVNNSAIAGDWNQVVSVEIALLVSSQAEDPNYSDGNTYALADYPVTPHATRLQHRRQVVRANVSLRNIKFVIRGPKE